MLLSKETRAGEAVSNTVVLIHGAWLTPLAWEKFKVRYEGQGGASTV